MARLEHGCVRDGAQAEGAVMIQVQLKLRLTKAQEREAERWLWHMADTNDKALRFAPIGNVSSAKKVKAGTQIIMGIGDDICAKIAFGDLVGGFIYCDRKRFEEVKAQMESKDAEEGK